MSNNPNTSAITVSAKSEESGIVIPDNQTSATSQKKRSASISTQMQLLVLAKQFVLDGGLLPVEKQMPLEDRAQKRGRIDHLRKQQNLEAIINKSLAYCSNSDIADRADQDWFNRFLTLAEDISNRTMQDLWAKILVGEISRPGSYSLKSLKIFRSMSINDAKLLAKVCTLAIKDQTHKNIRIISGGYQIPGLFNFFNKNRVHRINLNKFGLSYSELMILAENDLVFLQEAESNPLAKDETLHFNFNGQAISCTAKKSQCVLNFYKFTPSGTELAHLISDNPNEEYLATIKAELSAQFEIK